MAINTPDLNLEVYRTMTASIGTLRDFVRAHLQAAHGPDWETAGIPDPPREYLTQRRARESSVSWHCSTGLDLLAFAGFVNLFEIIAADSVLLGRFSVMVPDTHALRLRFLELDTILNRLGYVRPVSEIDLELLVGFDRRLRQICGTEAEAPLPVTTAPAAEPPRPAVASEPLAPLAPSPVSAPIAAAPPPRTPPSTRVAVPDEGPQSAALSALELQTALARRDDAAVLASLYREVTSVAESLWNEGMTPAVPVFEAVRESAWYRERFSPLNLRVISNFYDLLASVRARLADGEPRSSVQDFLKDRNFAQLLLDLRDVFKPLNRPAGGSRPA